MQELTGAIRKGGQAQYLDKLQVERERGITVKVRHGRTGRIWIQDPVLKKLSLA